MWLPPWRMADSSIGHPGIFLTSPHLIAHMLTTLAQSSLFLQLQVATSLPATFVDVAHLYTNGKIRRILCLHTTASNSTSADSSRLDNTSQMNVYGQHTCRSYLLSIFATNLYHVQVDSLGLDDRRIRGHTHVRLQWCSRAPHF